MVKFERGNQTYTAWIKIDDSLPWIELKETFQTKSEAQESLREKLSAVRIKIVKMSQQNIQQKVQ
jgi:hypothetical protein